MFGARSQELDANKLKNGDDLESRPPQMLRNFFAIDFKGSS